VDFFFSNKEKIEGGGAVDSQRQRLVSFFVHKLRINEWLLSSLFVYVRLKEMKTQKTEGEGSIYKE